MINKETKLYGSFSNNPGHNGCQFFNTAFEKYGINSIYKSFYSENIEETIQSVKHLNMVRIQLHLSHELCNNKYSQLLN